MEWRTTSQDAEECEPGEEETRKHDDWCSLCIRGRGREEDCRNTIDEEQHVQDILLDQLFMGDDKEGKTLVFLVARQERQRPCSAR